MAEKKQEESFRVIDRRPFTTDGELRQEVVAEQEREAQREAKKPAGDRSRGGTRVNRHARRVAREDQGKSRDRRRELAARSFGKIENDVPGSQPGPGRTGRTSVESQDALTRRR